MAIIIIFLLFFSLFVPLIVQQAGQLAELDYGKISQSLETPIIQFQSYLERFGFSLEHKSSEDLVREALSGLFNPAKISDFYPAALGLVADAAQAMSALRSALVG